MAGLGAIAVAVIASVCALALSGLAAMTVWAVRTGSPRRPLVVGGLITSALALGGALVALALGVWSFDTGRFLVGMSAGVAVGLPLGCALILLDDWRRAARRPGRPLSSQNP